MKRLLAVLAAVGLAGCAFLPSEAPNLDGTSWRAIAVSGHVPVAGSEPTLSFESGGVRGSSGCNTYGGKVTIEGSKLTVTELGSTAMVCGDQFGADQIGQVEIAFMKVLGAADTIRLEPPNLVIEGIGGQIVFRPA